jgi:hypothetical protein
VNSAAASPAVSSDPESKTFHSTTANRTHSLARQAPISKLVAAPFLFVVAGLAALCASAASELSATIAWSCAGLVLYLLGLVSLVTIKTKSWGLLELKLGSWFIFYAAFAYGIGTLTIIPPQKASFAVADKTSVPLALALLAVGFTVFALGYVLGRARILQAPFRWGWGISTRSMSARVVGTSALYLLFAFGLAADFLTILLLGSYGYLGNSTTPDLGAWYSQPLIIVSAMKGVALFGLAYNVFVQQNARFLTALLPVLAVSLALGLLSGTKEAFITTILSVAVPYLMGRKKLPVLPIVGVALIYVLVVAPIVTSFRQDTITSGGRLDVGTALTVGVERIFSTDGYLANQRETEDSTSALTRFRLIDSLVLIKDQTPSDVPFRSLQEVLAAPIIGVVPRLLWPDKPVRLSANEFYQTYFGGTTMSSSAITLEGSLYLYGGVLPLLVGMLLVGVALRVLDDVVTARSSAIGALLFTILVPVVIKQELDVATLLAGTIILALTWFVGASLMSRSRDRNPDLGGRQA